MNIKSLTRHIAIIFGAGALVAPPGCSKENNVDQSQKNTYEVEVGPEGVNSAAGPEGTRISIPPGAVSEVVKIKLSVADPGELPAWPSGVAPAGPVITFEPHNFVFDKNVFIELPFDNGGSPSVLTAEPGGTWESVGATATAGFLVQFRTNHFSYYAAIAGGSSTMTPDSGARGDDAGIGGFGGIGGAGNDGGGGAAGGPGSVIACTDSTPDPGAPSPGTTNASGTLIDKTFTALDGYAFSGQFDGIGKADFFIVFTGYANACGYAMRTQSSPYSPPGTDGIGPAQLLRVQLTSNDGSTAFVPTTGSYPSGSVMARGIYIENNSTCGPVVQRPLDGTITVSNITSTQVSGSISMLGFTGNFSFPLCPGASISNEQGCCTAAL